MPRELIATGPGQTAFRNYDEPPLGDDQVRIRSEFAAPKHGTESHGFLGDTSLSQKSFDEQYRIFLPSEGKKAAFPRALGNMTVGVITEVGARVDRFTVGDRVYGHLPVRETHTVSQAGRWGGTPPLGAGSRESAIHRLPDGLNPRQVVCLDPAHFALAGVRDANVRIGECVAVFGLGAIGLMIVQMAVLSGAQRVFAVDPLQRRRELAEAFGAERSLDPGACDVGLEIKKATGKKGADVAIDASGSYAALQDAIRSVHYSGLVVTVSFYHGQGTALRLGEEWHLTRVTVRSSMPVWGNPSRDYPLWDDGRLEQTALDLMLAGKLNVEGIVAPVLPFDEAAEAYRLITEHPERCVKLGFSFA